MIRRISPSLILFYGLLGTTTLTPASAQTTPATPATPANLAAPSAPQGSAAASAPPSILIVTGTPTKPQADMNKNAQEASKATDRAAFFEAHLAALHAGLTLTSDQEKLWPPVEQAIRTMANIKADTREAVKNVLEPQDDETEMGRSHGGSDPSLETDPFLAVKAASVLLLERGKALQSLADASGPLYGSLSSDQKGRLPVLVRSFAPGNIKLRRFLALLTWDATVQKQESMMKRSDQAEQPGPRGGQRGGSQDDQRDDGIATHRGGPQGLSGRHQADEDQAEEEAEPGQMSGRMEAPRGYGMMQARPYGDTPPDADD